jgi:glycosyltransferase involved in cell wall biosynthesis
MNRLGILFVINDLQPGGAEMFMFRLAAYLQDRFAIFILSLNPENDDEAFVAAFQAQQTFQRISLPVLKEKGFKNRVFWKINALAYHLGMPGMHRRLMKRDFYRQLGKLLKKHNIVVANSSSSRSDAFAVRTLKKRFGIPVLITMHSSYNPSCWNQFGTKNQRIAHCLEVFEAADFIFYTAEENTEIFKELPKDVGQKREKCYLGFEIHGRSEMALPQMLEIPDKAPVFCMMARGIPEKGWLSAISSFLRVLEIIPEAHLVLISTETEYISDLKHRFGINTHIHFIGFQSFPAPWLARATCTLLPSRFPESLPYAIIESLAVGTPVFATPVAEIPEMMQSSCGMAGALIPFDANGNADEDALFQLLKQSCESPDDLAHWRQAAKASFQEKFSMEVCGTVYENRFNAIMNGKQT